MTNLLMKLEIGLENLPPERTPLEGRLLRDNPALQVEPYSDIRTLADYLSEAISF